MSTFFFFFLQHAGTTRSVSIVKAQTCRINRSSSALLICLRKCLVFFGQNVIWPADPQMTDPMSPPAALDARLDADHTR